MGQAAWFLFQRVVAALLALVLINAFPNCHSSSDVWNVFRSMEIIHQVGVIAITLLVSYVFIETMVMITRPIAVAISAMVTQLQRHHNPKGNPHRAVPQKRKRPRRHQGTHTAHQRLPPASPPERESG
jgi:hypothetical protein